MSKSDANMSVQALEKVMAHLLESVMNDPEASLTDKCKVIDRALKLETIKQKMSDAEFGSGFLMDAED